MPGWMCLKVVTLSTSMHRFHAKRLFPERDASECVTRVAPDMLDVLGTAADVNGKVHNWVLSKVYYTAFVQ